MVKKAQFQIYFVWYSWWYLCVTLICFVFLENSSNCTESWVSYRIMDDSSLQSNELSSRMPFVQRTNHEKGVEGTSRTDARRQHGRCAIFPSSSNNALLNHRIVCSSLIIWYLYRWWNRKLKSAKSQRWILDLNDKLLNFVLLCFFKSKAS